MPTSSLRSAPDHAVEGASCSKATGCHASDDLAAASQVDGITFAHMPQEGTRTETAHQAAQADAGVGHHDLLQQDGRDEQPLGETSRGGRARASSQQPAEHGGAEEQPGSGMHTPSATPARSELCGASRTPRPLVDRAEPGSPYVIRQPADALLTPPPAAAGAGAGAAAAGGARPEAAAERMWGAPGLAATPDAAAAEARESGTPGLFDPMFTPAADLRRPTSARQVLVPDGTPLKLPLPMSL